MSPAEHHNFTRFTPFVVMTGLVLLAGTFFTVLNLQQEQETRSRASSITNQVVNGGFESGTGSWNLWKRNTGNGTFVTTTSTKSEGITSAQVTVTATSANVYDLELAQYGKAVTAGQTYTVSFAAKASANRTIDVVVQDSVSPFTVYTRKTVNLTTAWQPFTFTFVSSESKTNAFVGFQMAKATGTVNIDDVKFYQGTPPVVTNTPVPAIPTATPAPLPSAPTGLQAIPGDAQITLNWNTIPDHWYYVYVRNVTKGETAFTRLQYPTTTATIIYKPTTNGQTYEFKVSAINGSGGEGPLSAPIAAVSNASVPTAVPPTPTKTPTPTTTAPTPTRTPTPTGAPTPTKTPTPTIAPTAVPQPTNTPMPTPTLVPGSTNINLTLALHGLGKGGDSANPNGTGNTNPGRPQRTVSVEVYNDANVLVKTVTGLVAFDSASGYFKGVVGLGADVASGAHQIRVKTDQFLRALVPGIQTLTAGQTKDLPLTALVSGDINNDNQLNILDYNILMGCYSDLSPAVNCPAGQELKADITDDGAVNQFDYNLFLRELINRGGQ